MIIIWKLNEAWPLKENYYGHFLLKLLKLKENSTTALRLLKFLILKKDAITFNTEKGLHHLLRTLKVFNIEKELYYFLETLKGFNFEKWLRQILITRKVCQNSYCTVLFWWTAASPRCLSYHIHDKRISSAPIFRLSDKWYVTRMKLLNFMNCRVSWTPDKLHGYLYPPPNYAHQVWH